MNDPQESAIPASAGAVYGPPVAGAFAWDAVTPHDVLRGVQFQIAVGQQQMLSMVTIDADGEVPEHSHPHEQCGIWLEGEADFVIGETTYHVRPGDSYIIPPHTPHSVRPCGHRARALDIFTPPREEYLKYRGR